MDATLILDDLDGSERESFDVRAEVEGGTLTVAGVPHKLFGGLNVVGRRSDNEEKNVGRLRSWREKYGGVLPVSAVLLEGQSITSEHAIIYCEEGGLYFVKDLKSRNKTHLRHDGQKTVVRPEDRYQVQSGDILTFGTVEGIFTRGATTSPSAEDAPTTNDEATQDLAGFQQMMMAQQKLLTSDATAAAAEDTEKTPAFSEACTLAKLPQEPPEAGSLVAGAHQQLQQPGNEPVDTELPSPHSTGVAACGQPADAAEAVTHPSVTAALAVGLGAAETRETTTSASEGDAVPGTVPQTLGFDSADDVWQGSEESGQLPVAAVGGAGKLPLAPTFEVAPASPTLARQQQAEQKQRAGRTVPLHGAAQPEQGSPAAAGRMLAGVAAGCSTEVAEAAAAAPFDKHAAPGQAITSSADDRRQMPIIQSAATQPAAGLQATAAHDSSDVTRANSPEQALEGDETTSVEKRAPTSGWRTKKGHSDIGASDRLSAPVPVTSALPAAIHPAENIGPASHAAAEPLLSMSDAAQPADQGGTVSGGAVPLADNCDAVAAELTPGKADKGAVQETTAAQMPLTHLAAKSASNQQGRPSRDSQGVSNSQLEDALAAVGGLANVFPSTQFVDPAQECDGDAEDRSCSTNPDPGASARPTDQTEAEVMAAPAPTFEPGTGRKEVVGQLAKSKAWFEETPAEESVEGLLMPVKRTPPEVEAPTAGAGNATERDKGSVVRSKRTAAGSTPAAAATRASGRVQAKSAGDSARPNRPAQRPPAAQLSKPAQHGKATTRARDQTPDVTSPQETTARREPAARAAGGHRAPERNRKSKTPSPAADPDKPSAIAAKPAAVKKPVTRKSSKQRQPQDVPQAKPATEPRPTRGRATKRTTPPAGVVAFDSVGASTRMRRAKDHTPEQPGAASDAADAQRMQRARKANTAAASVPAGELASSSVRSPMTLQARKAEGTPSTAAGAQEDRHAAILGASAKHLAAASVGQQRKRGRSHTPPANLSSTTAKRQRVTRLRANAAAQMESTTVEEPAANDHIALLPQQPASNRTSGAGAAAEGACGVWGRSFPGQTAKEVAAEAEIETTSNRSGDIASMAKSLEPAVQRLGKGSRSGRPAAIVAAAPKEDADVTPADAVGSRTIRNRNSSVRQADIVHFSTSINEALKKTLRQKIERLGGRVTDDESNFTVFVVLNPDKRTGAGGFRKSFAALWALAAGRPIVTPDWVEAAAAAGSMTATAAAKVAHLLADKAAEQEHSFDLGRSYQRAQQKLLLADLQGNPVPVFLSPGLQKAEKDGGAGLEILIRAAGGRVASMLSKDFATAEGGGLLLGDEKAAAKERKWFKGKLAAKGVPVFGRSKLVGAIMKQEFDRASDALFTV